MKVTLMVQVPLAAKVEGLMGQVPLVAKVECLRVQLLVFLKSPGLVPVYTLFPYTTLFRSGLESVTAWAAPVVPTFWFPKSGTGDGERTGSDTPVPDTPAV